MRTLLSAERLRELLSYDPATGEFRWRVGRPGGRAQAGDKPGNITSKGYLSISVDSVRYQAHRLAWLYVTGEWPVAQIDHRNQNKLDNRLSNLRPATVREQAFNRPIPKSNTSGILGVKGRKDSPNWEAFVCVDKRYVSLGWFPTKEQASAVRLAGARALFGEFAPENRHAA